MSLKVPTLTGFDAVAAYKPKIPANAIRDATIIFAIISLSSRLAYAVFMSVVPAICTALLLRIIKSSNSWGAVLLAYFGLFVAEQLLWGWLHG